MPDKLLTYADVEDLLQLRRSAIKRLVSIGDLTALRISRRATRFEAKNVEAFIAKLRKQSVGKFKYIG